MASVRSLADFKGKVVVLFFGYTQCPDVCPTSLSELAQAKQLLGARASGCRACSSASTPSATRPRS
jgi:cytochrome oxidase Cu insertion factor (SCO1/SenC/PrrC family)